MLSRILSKYTFATATNASVATSDAFKGLRKYVMDYQPYRAQKGLNGDINFDKDMKPALDHYKKLGFTRRELGNIFKQKISALCINNGNNERLKQDIIQLSSFLQSEFKFSNEVIRRIVQNNHSLLAVNQEDIKQRFESLKKNLNINDQQAIDIIVLYPQIFTSNMENKINKVKKTFSIWAGFTEEQSNHILSLYPFMVDFNQQYIHDNIKLLLNKGFSSANIYTLVVNNPDTLLLSTQLLNMSFNVPKKINITQIETVKVFVENPELITICPMSIIPLKIKMLRSYRILKDNFKDIWLNHTNLFTNSINSLDLKNKYLNQRASLTFKKPQDLADYFSHSYSGVIRPRCEVAINLSKKIDLDVDLNLPEEEFLKKYDIPKEEYEKVKAEYPVHEEKDFKQRFYHKFTKSI